MATGIRSLCSVLLPLTYSTIVVAGALEVAVIVVLVVVAGALAVG